MKVVKSEYTGCHFVGADVGHVTSSTGWGWQPLRHDARGPQSDGDIQVWLLTQKILFSTFFQFIKLT